MYQYKSVHITNYRCLADLRLDALTRVNLVAGPNGVGKTTLLECVFLLSGPRNPGLTINLDAFRGVTEYGLQLSPEAAMPWAYLFNLSPIRREIELATEMMDGSSRVLRIADVPPEELPSIPLQAPLGPQGPQGTFAAQPLTHALRLQHLAGQGTEPETYYLLLTAAGFMMYPPPGPVPFPGFILGSATRVKNEEDLRRFDEQEKRGDRPRLVEVLQVLEPRLKALALHYFAGVLRIHGDLGLGEPIPLAYMGEGLVRLASMVLAIKEARGGVVLIDEIENGIYYDHLPGVWQAIASVARQVDAQIFATTHSRECVAAAHRAFSKSGSYDFALHRMESYEGQVRAVTFAEDELEAALDLHMEVR
jgi:energy-coupling factor transporter ATP-binding protein EcfA2